MQPNAVSIKSTEGNRTLRFFNRDGDYFTVSVEGDGPQVQKGIWGYTDSSGVADLFESLARDWTGWTDERWWQSIEGDLRIDATCSKTGQVKLLISVRNNDWKDDWRTVIPVFTEAGALDRIYEQSRGFFGE